MCRDKSADKSTDETFHEGLLAGIGAVRDAIDQFVEKQERSRQVARVLAEIRAQKETFEPVPDDVPQPVDALIDDLRKAKGELEILRDDLHSPAAWESRLEAALAYVGYAEDRAGEVWHELKGTADRVDWEKGTGGEFDAF